MRECKRNKHHRCPQSQGGKKIVNGHRNIVYVPVNDHTSWHQLFLNYPPEVICRIINSTWLDPRYEFICVKRKPGKRKRKER